MTRWFRFYDEALNDPKVQRLPAELFKFWVNILCIASRGDGRLPCLEDMAFALRTDEKTTSAHLDALHASGLIDLLDGDVAVPHNWDGRQFKSDVSTERVKRHRFRKRNVSSTVSETPPDTEQRQKTEAETSSLRSDGAASAPAIEDPRTLLFRQGLLYLSAITGKPETKLRSMVGKWLRDCDDDALRVLTVISQANRDRPAEPVAWIESRIRPHRNGHDPPSSGKVIQNIPVADEAYVARLRAERATRN